jgi:hypothetical protein
LEKEVRAALSHKLPRASLLDLIKEGYRAAIRESKKRRCIVDKPRATKIAKQGKISQSVKRIVEKRDGGEGTPGNIIQLCEKHHLLATEIAWGADKIERFRKRPREKAADERQSQIDFNASP